MLYLGRRRHTTGTHTLGHCIIHAKTAKHRNVSGLLFTHKIADPQSDVKGSFQGEKFYYVSPRKPQAG